MSKTAAALVLLLLAGCGSSDQSDNNCACTISVSTDAGVIAKLNLGCGQQGCVAGMSYGCDNDDVVSLGVCQPDLAIPAVRNDLGMAVCYPIGAGCSTSLPCCSTGDAGVTATCDPVSSACCAPTGSACNTSSDCCPGKTCVPGSGHNVCGS